ncbi:MAG: glutamine amidotransferase [uncultured bacterium]|nr:MAG: glutamine amidotransferase [uncultured bacterium]
MQRKKLKNPILVGISYNPEIGGPATDSIINIMFNLGASVVYLDYRIIVPLTVNVERVYESKEQMMEVYKEAKIRAKFFLTDIDCLILPGNAAVVDPRLFNEKPQGDDRIDLPRAIAEMALAHIALQQGMPILAVCGGHQIINVYLGGKTAPLSDDESEQQGYLEYAKIIFNPVSELSDIIFDQHNKNIPITKKFFGAHAHVVKQIGGQKLINDCDDYLIVAAVANDKNYNIEAVEAKYGVPVFSLQFHCEVGAKGLFSVLTSKIEYQAASLKDRLTNKKIFDYFIAAAETYYNKKLMTHEIANIIPKKKEHDTIQHETPPKKLKKTLLLTTQSSIFRETSTTNKNEKIQNKSYKKIK